MPLSFFLSSSQAGPQAPLTFPPLSAERPLSTEALPANPLCSSGGAGSLTYAARARSAPHLAGEERSSCLPFCERKKKKATLRLVTLQGGGPATP